MPSSYSPIQSDNTWSTNLKIYRVTGEGGTFLHPAPLKATIGTRRRERGKKRRLGSETKREFVFQELGEWYLGLPRVHAKRSYAMDISRMAVLLDEFWNCNVREIKRSFKRACRAAGIEDFRCHNLRHTFNTNMRKAGVDRSVIMKITGHKTMSMFERYNTVDGDDPIEACKRLDAFLTPSEPVQEVTAILLQSPLQ